MPAPVVEVVREDRGIPGAGVKRELTGRNFQPELNPFPG